MKAFFKICFLILNSLFIKLHFVVFLPAYNNYRTDAVQASLTSSLQSVGKAFAACLTLNTFANCNTLTGMGVSCPSCGNEGGTDPKYCVDATGSVGGSSYKACMTTEGGVPTIVGNWASPCSGVTVTYGCSSAALVAPNKTCSQLGCSASATAPTVGGTCSSPATHNCTTSNAGDMTNATGVQGTCSTTAGTCS